MNICVNLHLNVRAQVLVDNLFEDVEPLAVLGVRLAGEGEREEATAAVPAAGAREFLVKFPEEDEVRGLNTCVHRLWRPEGEVSSCMHAWVGLSVSFSFSINSGLGFSNLFSHILPALDYSGMLFLNCI